MADLTSLASLLVADLIGGIGGLGQQQWGIYLGGAPVIIADTVVSVEYKRDFSISDYPLEQGAFETYDKVELPFDVHVKFASGGSPAARQEMIDSIEGILGDLNFYDIVTPDAVYTSVNILHHDYRRTATNGLGMVVSEVWGRQVRVSAQTAFTATQSPSGSDPVAGGQVQPAAPSGAQEAGALSAVAAA